MQSCRERLRTTIARQPTDSQMWWASPACRSIEAAEDAARRKDLDTGWGAIHDAERLRVFGMGDVELVTRAAALKVETQAKLRG